MYTYQTETTRSSGETDREKWKPDTRSRKTTTKTCDDCKRDRVRKPISSDADGRKS